MSSVNKTILIGNLGADPEIKSFTNGGRIANMRVATTESWKDRQTGERKSQTEWHSVVVSGDGLVGVVERFLRKGSKVYLEGKLKTRKWQDQSGNDRYSTEVVARDLVMLDGKPADSGSTGGGGGWNTTPEQGAGRTTGGYDDLADDIPFVTDGFHR